MNLIRKPTYISAGSILLIDTEKVHHSVSPLVETDGECIVLSMDFVTRSSGIDSSSLNEEPAETTISNYKTNDKQSIVF